MSSHHAWRRLVVLAVAGGILAAVLPEMEAQAQRPFRVHDPFYRTETARRTFFDGYALSTQVSYQTSGALQGEGAADPDPLGFSFRADYALARRIDLSALFDASGSGAGRRVTLSWIALKYYRNVDGTDDYALRLAVDPASDGRVGFPQVDAAFIYSTTLSPVMTSDFALGVRRVRIGFEQLVPLENTGEVPLHEVIYTRANGWELHSMISYSALLDPAGSNVFVAFAAELSLYQLIDLTLQGPARSTAHMPMLLGVGASAAANTPEPPVTERAETYRESTDEEEYHSSVLWLRTGATFNRPSYQLLPFVSIPLGQWMPGLARWHRARLHVGARFMLR